MAQLQDENAVLKEDLGFLRNIMSSGTTPEGIGVSNLKVDGTQTIGSWKRSSLGLREVSTIQTNGKRIQSRKAALSAR